MATIAEEEKKKRGSYGDAAAAALDSDVTQLKYGKPGDFPVNPDGTPMQKMGFGPSAAAPTAPTAPAAPALSAPTEKPPAYSTSTLAKPEQPQSDYARQMKEVGGFLVDTPIKAIKTLVSAPGYGFSKPDDPQQAATQPAPAAVPAAQAAPKPVVPAPSAAPAPVVAPAAVAESAPDGSPKVNDPGQVTSADRMAMDAKAHADELASIKLRQQIQDGGAPAEGFTPATIRHSGNDWAARNNLRNLEVSASSITNQPGFSRGGRGYVPPAVAAYQAGLQTDAALQQAQPGMDQTAMRENAGIQREGMQQDGATARTGMQEKGASARDAGRTALARDEFGLKKEAAGFQTRAAKRLEDLQASYQNAKTPEERAGIAQQLRELQVKDAPAEWGVQVTPSIKNADGSTTEGSVYRFNKATGQTERVDGAGQPALPPGMKRQIGTSNGRPVYEDMNGKQVIAKG